MIKTTAIIIASAASLGASTTAPIAPAPISAPAYFELTAGPLHITREDGETHVTFDPASDSLLRVELASGKTLNIQL